MRKEGMSSGERIVRLRREGTDDKTQGGYGYSIRENITFGKPLTFWVSISLAGSFNTVFCGDFRFDSIVPELSDGGPIS